LASEQDTAHSASRIEEMRQHAVIRRKTSPPRGVLQTALVDGARSRHVRYHPSPDLEPFVEHYWSVAWDFRGRTPERVEILPHPSVHLVFQRRVGARIVGVTRAKFSRLLRGKGEIFAVKFTPGGFYPFLRAPVSTLTDTTSSIDLAFGADGRTLAGAMLATRTDEARVAHVEAFLRSRLGSDVDDTVARVAELVYIARRDHTIVKVDDLASRSGMNTRTLQRLFAKYVGVSPKWVIQRYRLHEAAEQLATGGIEQATLALALGYSDQAHFVRDFKAVVGTSPAAFASLTRTASSRR
jgi:AraC-like DNA-binding protein